MYKGTKMIKKIISLLVIIAIAFFCTTTVATYAKDKKEDNKNYTVAVIKTGKGEMKAVLFTERAPITTENFINLANEDFYKDMIFHRVVEDFVIQTGDPTGTGAGGSGKTIPLEIHKKLKHKKKGMLGMARKADPDSGTSQFYITHKKVPKLDYHYAVFGQVYDGLDVIDEIRRGDTLESVEIIEVPKKDIKLK